MPTPAELLARLDAIGAAVAESGHALALLGLGSVGLELERLDAYSDLDFFVIAAPGSRAWFLDDLGWLGGTAPLAYAFRNTADGYKALFGDGIFCEFAVFEPAELERIPFAEGRIIWSAPGVDARIARPMHAAEAGGQQSAAWHLGEALTNLYVGLLREARGERLSAARFIQHYAVDRLMALAELGDEPPPVARDGFAPERRLEGRFPALARQLPAFMQGYGRSRESALAILAFLEDSFAVPAALAQVIRELCAAG